MSVASQTTYDEAWEQAQAAEHFGLVYPLLQSFHGSCNICPVERVFSYGGIIAHPERARLK